MWNKNVPVESGLYFRVCIETQIRELVLVTVNCIQGRIVCHVLCDENQRSPNSCIMYEEYKLEGKFLWSPISFPPMPDDSMCSTYEDEISTLEEVREFIDV